MSATESHMERNSLVTFIQAAIAMATLAAGLLPTSCNGYFRATPFSLESGLTVRTPVVLEHDRPRASRNGVIGTFLLEDGRIIFLHDTDGDGVPDQARDGHRRWEIKPPSSNETGIDGQSSYMDSTLPYRNPRFGNRSAEEWLAATGLDEATQGAGVVHPVWVHEIRTSTWFIDLTIPATSDCVRSSFHDHGIDYQWDALTNPDGPDYELWRVAGDITEVCRFVVSCGIHELRAQIPQGLLEIEYVMEADGIRVTMDDVEMEWLSLD